MVASCPLCQSRSVSCLPRSPTSRELAQGRGDVLAGGTGLAFGPGPFVEGDPRAGLFCIPVCSDRRRDLQPDVVHRIAEIDAVDTAVVSGDDLEPAGNEPGTPGVDIFTR